MFRWNRSSKYCARQKRALRVRKRIKQQLKPRLSVSKSNRHLQVQIIDDEQGKTVVGLTTYSKEFRGEKLDKKSRKAAVELGARIAERAQKQGIREVVLDRGGFKYHGLIADLANAARAGGLQF